MKTSALKLFALLGATAICGHAHAGDKILAPLSDQSAIVDCSWGASSKRIGKGEFFQAEHDNSRAVMNLDGVDTQLTLSSQRGNLRNLGSVLTAIYRGKATIVYATYKTTWLCPKDETSESCEVTRFDATYEVRKSSRHQIVNAVGSVGC